FKIKNVTGQKNNTRSRESQNRIDDKVKASQLQYCRACQAVMVLRGPGDWETALLVLNPGDVRALNERQLTEQEKVEERQVRARSDTNMGTTNEDNEDDLADIRVVAKPAEIGEGARRPSWIWFQTSGHEDMSDPLMQAALRVKWAKAKARADRWEEEVILLDEEMRRVLVFCGWKNTWWKEQIVNRPEGSVGVSPELVEGLSAYAESQAAMETALAMSFAGKW
ncbi:hypothetical protein PILCRDRAFT_44104, partial [Piloderma croceum F 1598]